MLGCEVAKWPADCKSVVRDAVLLVFGEVYRRLIHYFSRWPWHLIAVADPDVSLDVKKHTAKMLFEVAEDVLDRQFSLKIKRLAGSWEVASVKWVCRSSISGVGDEADFHDFDLGVFRPKGWPRRGMGGGANQGLAHDRPPLR